ncbi:thyrotropin-releasing hormone-degrading ectoenzyme-like [Harpegnathos saltator]|uniref:thyrotropin-releasing hormone-degrading ectoenzyme-like n=1 Tax=Harpegnathos saltator TaxID=610380 RepID=UPI000DBEEF1F|nr:thyrotropin-releasing hormone-degrading ectoenzyme-like [Harpegnathos saltator]
MSLQNNNNNMASLILLLIYISMCASQKFIVTDNDQYFNMDKENCWSVSPDDRLLVNISRPIRYSIHLTIYMNYDIIFGTSNITVMVENPTRYISLHAYKLHITNYNLISLKSLNTFESYTLVGYRYCKRSQILDMRFNKTISVGIYILMIHFEIPNCIRTVLNTYEYKIGKTKVSTIRLFITKFNMARGLFPCWDEPAIKAIFQITITYTKKYRIFSNVAERNKEMCTSFCTSHFNETPPMSAFNVFFVLLEGNVRSSEISQTDFIWYLPGYEMLQDIKNTISLVEWQVKQITGLDKTFPRNDFILFPNNTMKTMGYFGFIIYKYIIIVIQIL